MNFELPKGIKIGHAGDEFTGVTVILAESGCVCGCDVRGGAPGTRETDLLKSEKMMREINAIALCGGSAYGLEAACGVMEYLKERKSGFKVGDKIVPIVPAAVIYDLIGADYHYPDKAMGLAACKNASDKPVFGRVGAGTGATVGKIRGAKYASKGGVGAATVKVMGVNVTAVVVVNAFGDVYDHKTDKIIAGSLDRTNGFLNTKDTILRGKIMRLLFGTNTTIGCIITDGKLDKPGVNKLASSGHDGMAQSIKPVHTDYDGDTLFCLATGRKKVLNFAFLQIAAAEAVSRAITAAVTPLQPAGEAANATEPGEMAEEMTAEMIEKFLKELHNEE